MFNKNRYITKEQIKTLGWVLHKEFSEGNSEFRIDVPMEDLSNIYYCLSFEIFPHDIIEITTMVGESETRLFIGRVKNIEELRTIMRQLSIIDFDYKEYLRLGQASPPVITE